MIRQLSRSTTITLLLSPAGILLISATRLLIVSNSNPATAAAIVSSDGYINTLLGSLLPMVAIFMPYIALMLLFFRFVILSVLCFMAASLITPATAAPSVVLGMIHRDLLDMVNWIGKNAIGVSILFAITAILAISVAIDKGILGVARVAGTMMVIVLIPVMLHTYPLPLKHLAYYKSQLRQPWLPAERFDFSSRASVVAYKLSTDGDWVELLIASTGTVKFYREGSVISQSICQMAVRREYGTLVNIFPRKAGVPGCSARRQVPADGGGQPRPTALTWNPRRLIGPIAGTNIDPVLPSQK